MPGIWGGFRSFLKCWYVLLYLKVSVRETLRVYYFNSISVSSALVYSANTELDREFLTSPVTSYGLMRDWREHDQYFAMFGNNFLLATAHFVMCWQYRMRQWPWSLLGSISQFLNFNPVQEACKVNDSCPSFSLSHCSLLLLLCGYTHIRIHLHYTILLLHPGWQGHIDGVPPN